MKKLFGLILFLFVLTMFSCSQLQAESKNKPLIGEWVYEVSDAPYGYEKGSLIFSEKDGKTICVIKLDAGDLQVNDLKIVKNKITFSTMVQGSVVHLDLVRVKNKISGTVDSPEGPKTLSAIKK